MSGAIVLLLVTAITWRVATTLATHAADVPGARAAVKDFVFPDVYLTIWIVSWVARTLVRAPLHLWEAGIFHPAERALAYSEHMLGVTPLTVPLYWLTKSPLVTHQTLLFATFAGSAVAASTLIVYWTGSAAAGVVGGAMYGLAPWRFKHLVSVHLLSTFYLPLAVLFSARYLAEGRLRYLGAAAATTLAQALCSYSIAYPTFAALPAFAVGYAWLLPARLRRLTLLMAGYGVAGLLLSLISLPYLGVHQHGAVSIVPAWTPNVLLASSGTKLRDWLDPARGVFLGRVPFTLGLLGGLIVVWRIPRRHGGQTTDLPMVISLLSFSIPLFLLSTGPNGSAINAWLWHVVPGLDHYRVAYRFGLLLSLPVAILASLPVAALDRRRGGASPLWRGTLTWASAAAALTGFWIEARTPLTLEPFPGSESVPEVYRWLESHGASRPLLEIPATTDWFRPSDPSYVYWTLFHHLPLVNGYSGYSPPALSLVEELAAELPNPDALEILRRLTGLRWLVVHTGRLYDAERLAWEAPKGTSPDARFGGDLVFDVGETAVDWRERYRNPDPSRTLSGIPLLPLEINGEASVEYAGVLAVGRPVAVRVTLTNRGRQPWPALAVSAPFRTSLFLSWTTQDGVVGTPPIRAAIPRDLEPMGSITISLTVFAPPNPGQYQLGVAVSQEPPISLQPRHDQPVLTLGPLVTVSAVEPSAPQSPPTTRLP